MDVGREIEVSAGWVRTNVGLKWIDVRPAVFLPCPLPTDADDPSVDKIVDVDKLLEVAELPMEDEMVEDKPVEFLEVEVEEIDTKSIEEAVLLK